METTPNHTTSSGSASDATDKEIAPHECCPCVRRLRDRYEPKDARWSYEDAVQALNTANRWIEDWRARAEKAEAELERRAKVEKEPTQCQSRHQFSKIKGWDTLARCELKFGHDGEHRATISHGHLEYWE